MAEIGPLLLPPPAIIGGRSLAPARVGAGRQNGEDSAYLATVDATADSTSGGARAKQFRFRVVDGGRNDTLGNADLPATSRRTGNTEEAKQAAIGRDNAGTASKQIPLGTFSAPFLAQLIAQEQLQPGLHDPPVKQADRAYRLAGGDPAWTGEENTTARFQIAV